MDRLARRRWRWLGAAAVTAGAALTVSTLVAGTDRSAPAPPVFDEPAAAAVRSAATDPPADRWADRPTPSDVIVSDAPEPPLADADDEVASQAEPPPATGTTEPRGGTIAERGAAALARIDYRWEELGFDIRFMAPRRGIRGMIFPAERRIEIYVRLDDPLERTAHDLAHEIGHAVDVVHMTSERRSEWAERRGFDDSTPWWPCARCEDRATGSGDYAEVFALWQVGGRYFSSRVAPRPSPEELAALVAYFGPPETEEPEEEDEERRPLVPCVVSCR